MLGTTQAMPTVAVKDLDVARKFYEEALDLKPTDTGEPEVLAYKAGNSTILVYKSQYAGTNEATVVTWIVGDDLEGVMQALKARGVAFERYDLPGTTRNGDVHLAGSTKAAWFKDPDGNIHSLVSQ